MKKLGSLFIGLLLCSASLYAADPLLEQSCAQDGGHIVTSLTCPQSGAERVGEFCVIENKFYNGCSASVPGFKDFFFSACLLHDYCYHHEPATHGKSKSECDRHFLDDLKTLCGHHPSGFKCGLAAQATYQAVVQFGEEAWQCSNTVADYPEDLSQL